MLSLGKMSSDSAEVSQSLCFIMFMCVIMCVCVLFNNIVAFVSEKYINYLAILSNCPCVVNYNAVIIEESTTVIKQKLESGVYSLKGKIGRSKVWDYFFKADERFCGLQEQE